MSIRVYVCGHRAHNLQSFFVTFQLKSRYGFDIVHEKWSYAGIKTARSACTHIYTPILSRLLFSSLRVGWPYCYKSLCNNHDQLVFCEPPTVQGIGRDNETKHFPKIAIDLDNKRTKFTVQLKINQRFAVVLFFLSFTAQGCSCLCAFVCVRAQDFSIENWKKELKQ